MPLLLSILFATFLVVCLKSFEKYKVETLPAIVFNYITCVATGMIVSGVSTDITSIIHRPWFLPAAYLGCTFFCLFNLMGYVAINIGVTVTSVAGKLSMVIPVSVAIILYHESFGIINWLSFAFALAAVYLSSITEESHEKHLEARGLLFAFIIFIGSGINDSVVNYSSVKLMNPDEFSIFNIVIFFFAASLGLTVLLFRTFFLGKKHDFSLREVAGGIILGVPNYFSLLFLIKALNLTGWKSSVIFPVNNMGIVVLTAVCAEVIFREKLSKMNLAGIAIALAAIAMLIFI